MFEMKKFFLFFSFCMLSLLCRLSVAGMSDDHSGFKASLYGGTSNTSVNAGNLQGFAETDSLNPNSHSQYDFTWGFGTAYRFMLPDNMQKVLHDVSIGLDLMYLKDTQKGYVWLFQQPAYNNYYYHLSVTSLRLMADVELTLHPIGQYIFPFIEGGIGAARNTASYYDSPLLPGTTGLTIGSQSQIQFAYTVGGGIKIPLLHGSELSLRYLYVDLGNAKTSGAASVPLAAPVKMALTSQTWLIGLTHYFN